MANYLVRLRVTTHVTTRIVSRLHVPRPSAQSPLFATVANLTAHLLCSPAPQRDPAYPELQAAVAHLYGLTGDELRHLLGTFPLIDDGTKAQLSDGRGSANSSLRPRIETMRLPSRMISTVVVNIAKSQSRSRLYSTTETTTRATGVAIRTMRPACVRADAARGSKPRS